MYIISFPRCVVLFRVLQRNQIDRIMCVYTKVWQTQDLGLETQGRSNVMIQVQKPSSGRIPSYSEEVSLLLCSGLQLIGEAHTHYGGQSALLKLHLLKW